MQQRVGEEGGQRGACLVEHDVDFAELRGLKVVPLGRLARHDVGQLAHGELLAGVLRVDDKRYGVDGNLGRAHVDVGSAFLLVLGLEAAFLLGGEVARDDYAAGVEAEQRVESLGLCAVAHEYMRVGVLVLEYIDFLIEYILESVIAHHGRSARG